jgi:hypothetical protein
MHTSFAHGRMIRSCLLGLLMAATLAGVEVHVAPTGNDSAAGTNAAPLRTVQAGINRAVAGDTVVVHAGVYRERLTFPRNGTASSPIVLFGQPGAAIDGGDYFTGWERVTTLPGNVWRLAGSPYGRTIEMNMTWNEKYIAGIREELMDTTGLDTLSLGPQGWDAYDGTLYRSWNGIQALFGRLNGYTYIGFGDSAINPSQEILAFAPEKTGGATILLDGRSWITVRGLTVYNGKFQVYLRGANDCVVEDNILRGGQNTVLVDGGSARTRIRRNDLTLNYVHDLDPSNSRHWFIWAVFKQQSYWDRVAIELENIGADNEIYDNNIHQHWDGIQNVGSALRLKVHDNTIDHLADDGLEPVGDQTDAEWFDNDVSRCNILYRHKGMRSTDTMYVYGNRFYTESAAAWFPQGSEALGIYFFTGTAGKTYFYHNSFATKQGIATGSTSPATGLPNTWMVNNIVSVDRFWGGAGGFPTLPKFDYNYVGSDLASRLSWWGANGVMAKPGKLWSTTTTPDFRLTATSPARGIGIDLSQPWTMDGVTHPALPGMSPGYFSGTRPDVGAYQYQASGPSNQAPVVSAGSDHTITLPASVSLLGSATDDGLPASSVLTYAWSKVSGSGTVTFGSATSASSTAAFSVAGVYVLRLAVGDSALTGNDTLTVTVAADTTAPGTPAAPITSNATSATPTLSGTTEAYATITIFDDGVLIGSVIADGTGAWSWTVSPALVSGVHHLTVIATDAVHNASAASSATVVTVSASSGSGATSGSGNSGSAGGGCGLGVGVGVFGILAWAAGMLVFQRRVG